MFKSILVIKVKIENNMLNKLIFRASLLVCGQKLNALNRTQSTLHQ